MSQCWCWLWWLATQTSGSAPGGGQGGGGWRSGGRILPLLLWVRTLDLTTITFQIARQSLRRKKRWCLWDVIKLSWLGLFYIYPRFLPQNPPFHSPLYPHLRGASSCSPDMRGPWGEGAFTGEDQERELDGEWHTQNTWVTSQSSETGNIYKKMWKSLHLVQRSTPDPTPLVPFVHSY